MEIPGVLPEKLQKQRNSSGVVTNRSLSPWVQHRWNGGHITILKIRNTAWNAIPTCVLLALRAFPAPTCTGNANAARPARHLADLSLHQRQTTDQVTARRANGCPRKTELHNRRLTIWIASIPATGWVTADGRRRITSKRS